MLQGESFDEQLINSVESGNIEKVRSLLDKGANPDATRLLASEYHTVNLVSHGLCIPQKEVTYENNISALGYAINLAHTEIAKLLINRGADINGYSHSFVQKTHLDNAARLGRTEIVELLLNHGADIGARNSSGYTALHSAVRSFHYLGDGTEVVKKIVNLLLDSGIDINAQDNDGCTALHIAATYERVGITELLLSRGVDASIKGSVCFHYRRDMTALHYAANSSYNNARTIELLLKYNLDINAQDSEGQTPISLGLKKQILPSDSTLKVDVLFTFLVYGAALNEDDRSKINKNPNLQNCLTAFEKIKTMPYFGTLIKSNKDRRYILQCIENENEGQELAKEFHNIKKDYGFQEELSFIPERLLGLLEHVIRRNDSAIRNLCYFVGIIKGEKYATLLPYLVSDQIFSYLSHKDLNNLNVAYHSDITGNEYDDLKTEAYIEFKREAYEAYKEFKQDGKALLGSVNKISESLDTLKGVSEKGNSSQEANNCIQPFSTGKQPQKTSPIKRLCVPFIAVGIYTIVVLSTDTMFNSIIAASIFIIAAAFAVACFAIVKACEKVSKEKNQNSNISTCIVPDDIPIECLRRSSVTIDFFQNCHRE